MLNADVLPYTGETAIMPRDLYGELTSFVTRPLIRSCSGHVWGEPERGIPAQTIAMPESALPDSEADPILMARQGTIRRLVESGEQPRPA